MTIRNKMLLIIGVSLLCLAGLVYATSRVTFMRGLEEIEKRNTSQHVEQVLAAFSNLLTNLEISTADWAEWDDTYDFIENENEQYIKSNLGDGTFISLRINLVLFINTSGHIVFGKAFDLQNEGEIQTPPDLLGHISDNSIILSKDGTQNYTSGIVLLNDGPLIIAAQPILTSESEGPARGTLIFARYLDSETVDYLSQLVLSPITIRPVYDATYPDFREALSSLSPEKPIFVKPLSKQYISGYSLIKDIYGKPSLVLRVDVPRDVSQLGQTTTSYYILSILGVGILVSGLAMLMAQKQIFSRFSRLITGINRIANSGDTSARISVGGKDEMSLIAGTVNGMLATIDEATAKIRESEERYRDLFENATDLIQSVTTDGRFIYVNEAWRKTLGYSEEEVANLSLRDIIHADYMPLYKEIAQKVILEPVDNVEAGFVTKDGTKIIVEGNISCRFKGGELVSIRGIFRNITERKQAEEKLQLLYEQEKEIRQKLEEETQKRIEFTRALVHELKTPITPVLAATELLLEEVKDERTMRLVQTIDRSAANLNRRIDELMDLIRGETDMLKLNLESVDAVSLLREIGYQMMPVALRDGHSLIVELPTSNPVVLADRDRLRQILMNLLNNAFKFTPSGGQITLEARQDGANLVVEVRDTGPGISDEDQMRLFSPYFRRVEDRERLSGLGLGLALSKKLVELHGGKIWVKSKKGEGSTFSFSIPLVSGNEKRGQATPRRKP